MIKLFEFQEKEIRTTLINGELWFSGQDVFTILGLTWKGASDLIKKRGISTKRVMKKGYETFGGIQEMVFIDEIALYKISLRANKSEVADKFTDWVSELLVKIRKAVDSGNTYELKEHLNIKIQKEYSKQINSLNFRNGGIEQTIDYNTKNCKLHTNLTPKEVIEIGKQQGLKSKDTTSAKQVLRTLKPELSASMSFTDKLVSENNIKHELAAQTSTELVQPLFKRLMELGISYEQLK